MKSKIFFVEKWRFFSKKVFWAGCFFVILGLVFFLFEKDIGTALLVLAYFLLLLGGSSWLFCHSLKGILEKKILVIGDEVAPITIYYGRAAIIWGIIGIVLALLFFLLSFLPVLFLFFLRVM